MINPPQKILQTPQKIFFIQILNTLGKRIFSAIKNEFTADRAKALFNDLAFLCITQMKCLLFVGLGAALDFIDAAAIYTCFIQHVINSLKKTGKGAIVIPTWFITAKSGIENKILHKIVDDKIVYGCVSMPSNVFANTGTNVSVLFFDKSATTDKVILIDASNLGVED